jgi:hypothetical protein
MTMNCSTARNRILALSQKAAMPDELTTHLDGCAACQAWRQLLQQVDAAIAHAPVPASDGKAKRQLIAQFRPETVAVAKTKPERKSDKLATPKKVVSPIMPAKPRRPLGERLAKLWPAGLVAAGLLVAAVGWAVFGGKSQDNTQTVAVAPDPLLEKAVASKAKLDTASSPAEKIVVLDDLAKGIHEQAKALAKVSPDDMKSLAHMYEQVVADALVSQAKAVSPDERAKALTRCRDSLRETENEANRLAGEAPPASVQPLRDIARVAKESGNTLAQLMQQGRAS